VIIAVDASTLVLIVNPNATPPIDPSTGSPVLNMPDRVAKLVADIDAKKDTLIIPTPALSEVLVKAGVAGPELLQRLAKLARVRVASFDQRCAYELAQMTIKALAKGDKKDGHKQPWQKVKLDRQIIAIARVHMAEKLYSDDSDMVDFCGRLGLPTQCSWDLPVPASAVTLFTLAGIDPSSPPAVPSFAQSLTNGGIDT
jgi:hypothetical protein